MSGFWNQKYHVALSFEESIFFVEGTGLTAFYKMVWAPDASVWVLVTDIVQLHG